MQLPVHREGLPIIAGFLLVAALLWFLWAPLGLFGGVLCAWCIWFFRDPDRVPPDIPGAILSPADGRLLPVTVASPPAELAMGSAPRTRISIFMNIFNVHVNRIPADGTIVDTHYRPGRFFNASFDKASEHNERLSARMRLDTGEELVFVQIAGLVARRIRSTLGKGDAVHRGARFGLIRFGSRVDVYLPADAEVCISAGQHMIAGETVIARLGGHNDPVELGSSGGDGGMAQ
jgi:phosphatidylserine decarboxylase